MLQVYTVDAVAKRADRLVVTRRDVHRTRSYVEFSQDGRILAFTTADNSLCLVDLHDGRALWTANAPLLKTNYPLPRVAATTCLEFSHDQR